MQPCANSSATRSLAKKLMPRTPAAGSVTPPFRAEVIGSLLRPRALKDAAVQAATSPEGAAAYARVLEAEIARVVAKQEDLGLAVATDGEFGRTSWFGFFFERMD